MCHIHLQIGESPEFGTIWSYRGGENIKSSDHHEPNRTSLVSFWEAWFLYPPWPRRSHVRSVEFPSTRCPFRDGWGVGGGSIFWRKPTVEAMKGSSKSLQYVVFTRFLLFNPEISLTSVAQEKKW